MIRNIFKPILTTLCAVLVSACTGSDSNPSFSRNLQESEVLQAALLANGLRGTDAGLPVSRTFGRRPILSARDGATIRGADESADGELAVELPLQLDAHQAARLTRLSLRVAAAAGHQFLTLDALAPGSALDLRLQINRGSGETLPPGFCLDLVLTDDLGRVSAPLRQCVERQSGAVAVVAPALAAFTADSPPRLSPLFLQQGLAARWSVQAAESGATAPATVAEGNDLLVEEIAPGLYTVTVEAGAFTDATQLRIVGTPPEFSALIGGAAAVSAGEPIALFGDAGPQTETDTLSYRWLRDGVEIARSQDVESTTQAEDIGQQYEYQLEVTRQSDGAVASASLQVVVRDPANLPPIARAGADQSVDEGSIVTLNGSQSTDLNDEPLSYQWTQIVSADSPAPRVNLENADQPQARFEAPDVSRDQTLDFRLTVTDPQGNSDADEVQVFVRNDLAGGG